MNRPDERRGRASYRPASPKIADLDADHLRMHRAQLVWQTPAEVLQ